MAPSEKLEIDTISENVMLRSFAFISRFQDWTMGGMESWGERGVEGGVCVRRSGGEGGVRRGEEEWGGGVGEKEG